MSTPSDDPGKVFTEGADATGTIPVPDFFPLSLIISQLSTIRRTQPVAALAAANQHRGELTDVFLQAIEQGVADPRQDFTKAGMLFNYGAYFLAKWREPRALPLFLRWFSLPDEDAFELGGDTVTQDGARFLAAVWNGNLDALKELIHNSQAHPACRSQGVRALAILAAWGDIPAAEVEIYLQSLARDGLERKRSQLWSDLAVVCLSLGFVSVFPDLRRAATDGLLDPSLSPPEPDQAPQPAPGELLKRFAERHPPVTDVIKETRWWAGFQPAGSVSPSAASMAGGRWEGHTYLAPPKVGRNDVCPCGSGKKFKKCCGV